MIVVNEILTRPPDIINQCGEEIWTGVGSNLAMVRLQPGTRSERHYHVVTKEWYFILMGHPVMELDSETLYLHKGVMVTIIPGQIHQIFNRTQKDVLFLVQTNIPWSADDQYFF